MTRDIAGILGPGRVAALIVLIGARLALAQAVPSPEQILGFPVGADYHLASYQQALEYFRALEGASRRIKLFEMGKTTMGKPMVYAVISSEENLANLDRFKEISRKLALARGLTDEEARRLAAEGKAVVYVDGGLHAAEVAPAQHNLQLAYDLVTSEDPTTRLVRDNTILLLVFPNPDGMDMVAQWYHGNVGTPYEVSPMPWLYHKYVGHDNNRDSFMVNMVETQNLARLSNHEWFPVVLYNQHQTGPFPARIFVPPNAEPVNPNEHPLVLRGKNLVGTAMSYAFEQEGKEGVISRLRYDLWYPGYVDQVGDFFNTISILTETQLYEYATPHFYTVDDFPEEFRDFTISGFYPSPWKGGWWRLKDAVDYDLTASKAVLHTAALYRENLLYNRYRMGQDNIRRFEKEPPHAWIIPREQRDAPTAALLLNKMILLGIEVCRAEDDFVSDGIHYPAGTWVIPMSQPFALFVKAVFEEQRFPDLTKYPALWQALVRPQTFPGAYLPPYDVVGWTLPYQMGVNMVSASTPLEARLAPLEKVDAPAGSVEAAGQAYLISPTTNNSFLAVNRILGKGGEVSRAQEPFRAGGMSHPAGTWIVGAGSVSRSFMTSLAGDLGLTIRTAAERVSAKSFRVKAPRVALYKSWVANIDEGWTRWLFERFEFPFANVCDADLKAGRLQERFDALVLPSQSTEEIVHGHQRGTVPPQYAGGIGETGVRNLKAFVEEGGTLVTLNTACLFALEELGLPLSDVLKDVRPKDRHDEAPADTKPAEFACPGSLLRIQFDTSHPVAYGMPEEAAGMFVESPAFRLHPASEEVKPVVVARYPKDDLLMSGYLRGEGYLQNQASAVAAPLGKGKVILLGFAVQSRGQPHGTFKLLFNSLYPGW